MNIKPVVEWHSPEEIPDVPKNTTKNFWIAVEYPTEREDRTLVFTAQYVNMPLELDENGESLNVEQFVDHSGDPMEAVGWYDLQVHVDYPEYYDSLDFNENYKLLGWAEYDKPDFSKVSNEETFLDTQAKIDALTIDDIRYWEVNEEGLWYCEELGAVVEFCGGRNIIYYGLERGASHLEEKYRYKRYL